MSIRTAIRVALRPIWRSLSSQRMLSQLLGVIVKGLDYIYPKDSRIIIFGSNNAKVMSGSPKVLFDSISSRFPEFRVYYLLRNASSPQEISPLSARGLFTFLRARFLVSSHGLNDFFFFRGSSRKKHISTWHGLPMKTIGRLQKGVSKLKECEIREYAETLDAFLVASKYDLALLCTALSFDARKAKMTGHPRNDCLVNAAVSTKTRLESITRRIPKNAKALLYAPTYRVSKADAPQKGAGLFPLDDYNEKTFLQYLERKNLVLLVRAHINDPISEQIPAHERVIPFGFNVHENINTILPEIDFLITDYSSIAYDFLLIGRPIIFLPHDLEEYSRNPGFIVDDYQFWTPGIKASTVKHVTSYIDLCLRGNDSYKERRKEFLNLVHHYQTSDSVSKFVQLLIEL